MNDKERAHRRRESEKLPTWAWLFFEALAVTGIVEKAIKMVGRPSSKRTYYRYKKNNRLFDREWRRSLEHFRHSVAQDPI